MKKSRFTNEQIAFAQHSRPTEIGGGSRNQRRQVQSDQHSQQQTSFHLAAKFRDKMLQIHLKLVCA